MPVHIVFAFKRVCVVYMDGCVRVPECVVKCVTLCDCV